MVQGRWQSHPRQSGPVIWASVEKSVSIQCQGRGEEGWGHGIMLTTQLTSQGSLELFKRLLNKS